MSDLDAHLRELVTEAVEEAVSRALEDVEPTAGERPEPSWRERLWSCPSETRLGLPEVVEALGRSESWVYNRTRDSASNPIPHAKIGGGLVFRAGELRHWVRATESVEVAGPSDPPEGTLSVERRAS